MFLSAKSSVDSWAHLATESLHKIEWPSDGKPGSSLKILDMVCPFLLLVEISNNSEAELAKIWIVRYILKYVIRRSSVYLKILLMLWIECKILSLFDAKHFQHTKFFS